MKEDYFLSFCHKSACITSLPFVYLTGTIPLSLSLGPSLGEDF